MGANVPTIEASIDLEVPAELAYDEWNAGRVQFSADTVSFEALEPTLTRLVAHVSFEPPDGLLEIGDALLMIEARIKNELERFRERVVERASAAGAPEEIAMDRSA
jgi:hypothetical protein